ncbi:hypothetical protein EGW08_002707 [Elysia chlorotica]|uniref:Uncharacterized protein n=1 Tax=Elysia chlorotica TaxID=188477 RepID=A0A3S1BJ36_ELYCH|nr:hypothetical protein EGW08_002707 [Elysia chlorotica]
MHRIYLLFIVGTSVVVSFGISGLLSALSSDFNGIHPKTIRKIRNAEDWPKLDGSLKNIFWVVQISDIHISLFVDPHRASDLLTLCEDYIKLINPESVIVTGDLTDAKKKGHIESIQLKDEWVVYQNIMKRCAAGIRARWVDIRGNHDCFDVHDFSSDNNYYRWFSATGPVYEKKKDFEEGFIHSVVRPDGSTYSFIGIDTCSRPGPNRPFNFFGYIDEKQSRHLKYLSAVTATSNHTVWFGHYPTSLNVQDPPNLREIMSGSIMYLCGHLHTMGNVVPRMYAKHSTGQLELELGDWKDNRMFRIIAFDNDIVSFTDAKLGQWPIILITNPKDNQFLSPRIEPVEMIYFSTHIRILIFSRSKIVRVKVYIDSKVLGLAQQAAPNSPLFVLHWNPQDFARGTHKMDVSVMTEDKNTGFASQYFSTGGQERGFSLLPRLLLMLNIYNVAQALFGLMVLVYVTALTLLRLCSNIRQYLFLRKYLLCTFVNSIVMKIWLASRVTSLFYLLVGSVVYMAFGPWFAGYILSDHIGVVFAWGIIVNGTFIAGGLTYIYAIFQFLTFSVPLTLLVGHILDQRRRQGSLYLQKNVLFVLFTLLMFTFVVYLACGEFVRAYGKIAFLLGPLRTGNVVLLPLAVRLALKADLKSTLVNSTF